MKRDKIVTTCVIILCAALFLSALSGGAVSVAMLNSGQYYANAADGLLLYDDYQESAFFQWGFDARVGELLLLLDRFRSEEYIRSGASIQPVRRESAIQDLFYNGRYMGDYNHNYNEPGSVTAPVAVWIGEGDHNYDDPGVSERFKEEYAEQIEQIEEILIRDDLRAFQDLKKKLDETAGFTYYATDGVTTATNLPGGAGAPVTSARFTAAPAYLIYESGMFEKAPASKELMNRTLAYVDSSLEATLHSQYNDALTIFFSYDEGYLAGMAEDYRIARADLLKWVIPTAACALLALIALIWLIVTTGRKDPEGNRQIHKIDRLFTELQLMIIATFGVGGGAIFGMLLDEGIRFGVSYDGGLYLNGTLSSILTGLLAAVVGMVSAVVGLCFILAVVRNLKAGRFLKNLLVYRALAAVWRGAKAFYYGGSVMQKVVLTTLAVCGVSATVVLAPVVAVLIVVFAPKWVKKYEGVKRGVEEVKSGNLSYKIDVSGEGELDELARGINEISEASNLAIQSELKNQRLKTDLISNVSHDLKTPLTSIITYVDLLKQEGLASPEAPKYLEILDQKSIRLKKLTEDLFDAAKASSGAIPVKFERVDLLSLINQGLGEMGDRMEASGLEFRLGASKEKYYVRADGQLLWRVVENLLSNVLKYAQEGSRVYIDLKEQNGKEGKASADVILEIKNISKTELNVDADELMERFKRGDEARSSEGSGLGLAIAKDLVKLQNGWFEIKIDGDLFKAIVMLESYAAGESETAQE
jgi:signal transduction histidine kinase